MLGNEAWLSVCITVYPKGEWIWGQGSAQVSQVFQQKEKKSLFFYLFYILFWGNWTLEDRTVMSRRQTKVLIYHQ